MSFMKTLIFNRKSPFLTSPFVYQIFNRRSVHHTNYTKGFNFDPSEKISDVFDRWRQKFGKTYVSEEEKLWRFKLFEESYRGVVEHNSRGDSSYTKGLNHFSDLTQDEQSRYSIPRFAWPSITSLWLDCGPQHHDPSEKISDVFDRWCKEYHITYDSEEEKLYRFKVFEKNYKFILEHKNYGYGLNYYADFTFDEFKADLKSSGSPIELMKDFSDEECHWEESDMSEESDLEEYLEEYGVAMEGKVEHKFDINPSMQSQENVLGKDK